MADWSYAGTLDDIWEGEMLAVHRRGVDVLLCNVDGDVFAYEDRCPHLANPLSEGRLDGPVLTCAAHEWSFDVRTGSGVNPAAACLRRYPVRLDGEQIFVEHADRRGSEHSHRARELGVGPVLQATPFARVVIAAIEDENDDVLVQDEGAYLRVLVPRVCRLSRAGDRGRHGLRRPLPR